MSKGEILFGGIHVAVTDTDAQLHTVHDDGGLSINLAGDLARLNVYLHGTPDELHWLADKLRAIVTAHESATTLAGEAAREVVTPETCDHLLLDANNDDYLECVRCGKRFTESDPPPERTGTLETS